MISYLKEKFPEIKEDYVVLTIYANAGFPGCTDGLKILLNNRYEVFAGKSFYFIYSGLQHETKDIDTYTDIAKLNFIKDSLGIIKDITIKESSFKSLEPRLTIVKNNKIISDTIYDWLHIQSGLIPTIKSNLGLE